MPSVRRHVRLVIAGQKIEVETNALDLARAEHDGEGDTVRGMRTLHEACKRARLDVPAKFDTFLDQLDSIDDLDDEDSLGGGDLDPTRTAG
jgi:hypothetical protein